MCDCVDPPKGKQAVPPTPENAAEYHAAYGEMIKVELISQFSGESPTTFRGPATRVNYGYRARGDIFHIWEADLLNSDGVFERVEVFEAESSLTEIPPPPTSITEQLQAATWDIEGDGRAKQMAESLNKPVKQIVSQPRRGGKSTAVKAARKSVAKSK